MATRMHGVLPVSVARDLSMGEMRQARQMGWLPPLGGGQDTDEAKPEGQAASAGKPNPAGEPEVPEGARNPDAVAKALKAERTAREKAEKDAKAAQAKLEKLEASGKTEAEKTAERLAALEKAHAEAERRATLAETAQATSVPADLLTGPESTSPEDLAAFAERVKAFAAEANKGDGSGPSSDGGARPRPAPKDLPKQIREAEEKGDWAAVSRLNAQLLRQVKPAA